MLYNSDRHIPISIVYIFVLLISSAITFAQQIQYINPLPGSEYVSPRTNIIIRVDYILDRTSLIDKQLLTVTGSRSGVHHGIQDISDDNQTFLFQPEREFVLNENVTVSLHEGLRALNGKNISARSFSFTIKSMSQIGYNASPTIYPDLQVLHHYNQDNIHSGFQKVNDSLPPDFPQFNISVNDHPSVDKLFLTDGQYLLILGDSGKPIWYRRMDSFGVDFKLQPNGLLTYYYFTSNCFLAMDSSFVVVDSFMCGNGYATDWHDLQLLSNGHALVMGRDMRTFDMSQLVEGGNTDAEVLGLIIQELDKQKRVVFEWRSWDHFKITDAIGVDFKQAFIPYVWGNSLEFDTDGNIILSSRHLCEVTKINRQTGNIIWRLGGKNNQFTFVNDTLGFSYQHDARRLPNGNLTLLDNGNLRQPQFSRAVEYQLNDTAMTATLVWQYRYSPDVFSMNQGNVQRLRNGNTLICWGNTSPTLTEVRADGGKAFELNIPNLSLNYRAFRFPWKLTTSLVKDFPNQFVLGQNYPNPISTSISRSTIQYSLFKREYVQIKLFDLFGHEIQSLVDEMNDAGLHSISFDASHLSSGVYFYRIITPTFTQTRSMIISK